MDAGEWGTLALRGRRRLGGWGACRPHGTGEGSPSGEIWSLQIPNLSDWGQGDQLPHPMGCASRACLPRGPWVMGQRGWERLRAEVTPPEDAGTGGLAWVGTGDLVRVVQPLRGLPLVLSWGSLHCNKGPKPGCPLQRAPWCSCSPRSRESWEQMQISGTHPDLFPVGFSVTPEVSLN